MTNISRYIRQTLDTMSFSPSDMKSMICLLEQKAEISEFPGLKMLFYQLRDTVTIYEDHVDKTPHVAITSNRSYARGIRNAVYRLEALTNNIDKHYPDLDSVASINILGCISAALDVALLPVSQHGHLERLKQNIFIGEERLAQQFFDRDYHTAPETLSFQQQIMPTYAERTTQTSATRGEPVK